MAPISVLLVDDNSFFLRMATRFLTGFADLRVLDSVSSAQQALDKAKELKPEVVLLDLNMPGIPGLALIPSLRAALPNSRIIVLTLWESDMYRQAALAAGAHDFVSKSLIASHLAPAIRRAHGPAVPAAT